MYQPTFRPEPLGKLTTTSGTPLRITSNLANATDGQKATGNTDPGQDFISNKIEIKADINNIGNLYVGKSNLNRTTLIGVVRVLIPGESWQLVASSQERNPYRVGDYYVDSDNTGDFCSGNADPI